MDSSSESSSTIGNEAAVPVPGPPSHSAGATIEREHPLKVAPIGVGASAEDLVTVVAHELRNFIAPIDMHLQLIECRADRDERLDDLRESAKARRAVARLNALVTDILDVARVEQGILVVDARPTPVVPLVKEVVGVLSSAQHPILVQAKEQLTALVDPGRIRQCLENILVNAIKHSPKLRPVNVVVARLATECGDAVRIEVADEGPGVPPDILPFIFERFVSRRGPQNRTGLGLGLFLSHQIALLHGGQLAVESELAKGARFTLTLPCGDLEPISS